jgi:hypothetical protein
MQATQLNELCREIETAYRDDTGQYNIRLGNITAREVFTTMYKHGIGLSCGKCFERKMREGFYRVAGRYFSGEHSAYYRKIMWQFYSCPDPLRDDTAECSCEDETGEISKDHVIPITRGGLEFDRENLQWMCLTCNIRKGNRTKEGYGTRSTAVAPG